MEVKPWEVVVSLIIIAVMLITGFAISEKITQNQLEKYQEYDSAVQIESEDLFRYGMKTNIGRSFVYGDLKTLDPVSFPEFEGKYSYIKKEEQEYREHSRIVTETYTDSNGKTHTRTKTEYYWTWDTMETYVKTSTKISFLNVEFAYGKIPFPAAMQLDVVNTGYHKRNIYYGTGTEFTGTIYTVLDSNDIEKTSFYNNSTISETIEKLESVHWIIIFWIFWIILTGCLVLGFYYLENNWLD